jgi:hypothetical protein
VLKVMRGVAGTIAADHETLAPAVIGLPEDFPAPVNSPALTPAPRSYAYGAAGAILVKEGLHVLNTGAASAMTLAAPTAAQDGMKLRIVAATAHAYTVTYTTGFNGGGAGVDEATFGGAIGDNMEIVAVKGTWYVLSTRNVTVA